MEKEIDSIIFDLGGVLIDWNPDYVYLNEFKGDKKKMNWFYQNICTMDWNENQDAGYPIKVATEEKIKEFPDYEKLIKIYYGRWEEMLKGQINDSVKILKKLIQLNKYKIIALTNWSNETFPVAQKRFKFLKLFHGIVVSGEEKTRKPYEKIYKIAINRYNLIPSRTVFIDDNERNLLGASKLSINTIHFKNPEQLKKDLIKLKIL